MPTSPSSSRPPRAVVAVPTAYHDDGQLDRDGQAAVAAAAVEVGADGVAVLDLMAGEVGELDDDERVAVLRAARDGAAGLPLVAGVGAPGPGQLGTARRLADAGADLLVVPLGRQLERTLEPIAELGVPLVLHHHPVATGAERGAAELARLARDVAARAVCSELAPVCDVVAELVTHQLAVLGGLGGLFLPEELEVGAQGTVAATALPGAVVATLRAHRSGDLRAASEVHRAATGYLRLEAGRGGSAVRSEAWRQQGRLRSGRVRRGLPLGPETKRAITRRLRELEVELVDPYPDADVRRH